MNFQDRAKKRFADLLPGERAILWKLYQNADVDLIDLAYSKTLGVIARKFTHMTALEVTPGEAYHLLQLLGAH